MIDPVLIQPIATVSGAVILGVFGIIAAYIHASIQSHRFPVTMPLCRSILMPKQRNDLTDLLVNKFNLEELHDLCFRMGIDYDFFGDKGRRIFAEQLIAYCERHEMIPLLIKIIREIRSDIVPVLTLIVGDISTDTETALYMTGGALVRLSIPLIALAFLGGVAGFGIGSKFESQTIEKMLIQASAVRRAGAYDSALQLYAEILRADPKNDEALLGKQSIFLALSATPTPSATPTYTMTPVPTSTHTMTPSLTSTRTPTPSPTPTPTLTPFPVTPIPLDKIKLGCEQGKFEAPNLGFLFPPTTCGAIANGVSLSWSVKSTGGYAGCIIDLAPVFASIARDNTHLGLRVSGKQGGEQFEIGLKSGEYEWKEPVESISEYEKQIAIPLANYSNMAVDLAKLDKLIIAFNHALGKPALEGRICITEIGFGTP